MKNEPLSGRLMPDTENNKTEYKAHYHLPGLFEFYELYKVFLPLYRGHREYFYDWCGETDLQQLTTETGTPG